MTSNLELKSNNKFPSYDTVMGGFVATIYRADSTITNSTHSGTIKHEIHNSNTTGGFIGGIWNSDMKMKNLVNQSDINTTSAGYNTVGGIIGNYGSYYKSYDTLHSFNFHGDNLTNNGDINSDTSNNRYRSAYSGGIIGSSTMDLSTITVENTHNKGNITSAISAGGTIDSTISAGGIIGSINNTKYGNSGGDGILSVINSSNIGVIKTTGSNDTAGGIIGTNNNSNPSIITNTHNTGEIIANTNGGGIIGTNSSSKLTLTNIYNTGVVTSIKKYPSIGYFGGIIGENDVVSLEMSDTYNKGDITGTSHTGGLIGELTYDSTSKISNTYNTGNIMSFNSRNQDTAGLIGSIVGGKLDITHSFNTGNVTMTSNYLTIGAYSTHVGGLVGSSSSSVNLNIANSYNTGEIKGFTVGSAYILMVGGIIGSGTNMTITDTYNTGNVSSNSQGILANNDAGGVIGGIRTIRDNDFRVIVSSTYNTGDVMNNTIHQSHNYAGGIIGHISITRINNSVKTVTIKDTYNRGKVTSNKVAGGIVGYSYNNYFTNPTSEIVEILHSYNYADITINGSNSFAGAIVGKRNSDALLTYTNNYWYAPTTNPPSNLDAGRKLTAATFKLASTFRNWYINQVGSKWIMLQGALYPTLISNPEVVAP